MLNIETKLPLRMARICHRVILINADKNNYARLSSTDRDEEEERERERMNERKKENDERLRVYLHCRVINRRKVRGREWSFNYAAKLNLRINLGTLIRQ